MTTDLPLTDDVFNTLLSPLSIGRYILSHRVVLAPLTRCRALNYVPQAAHVDYYSQRSTPSGLLVTEAVAVAQEAIGFPHSPGIFNDAQIEAWKKVVSAVHKRGGIIFCQLWHVGRASHTFYQPNSSAPVSSTNNPVPSPWTIRMPDNQPPQHFSCPRALTATEIPKVVEQFRQAARNALVAGFDGVEIHAAHGYLIDQFFKDGVNDRSDEYGGSIENRCRFGLQVISAIVHEIGADRTSVRISPVIDHVGAADTNPRALGLYLVEQLNSFKLAYLHLTEPRYTSQGVTETTENCMDFIRAYNGVVMSSGGYTRESGMEAIRSGYADLVAYGRLFISNPDLPIRFAFNTSLNEYDRSTFYTHDQVKGYTNYPALKLKPTELRVDQISQLNCSIATSPKALRRKELLRLIALVKLNLVPTISLLVNHSSPIAT